MKNKPYVISVYIYNKFLCKFYFEDFCKEPSQIVEHFRKIS